MLGFFPNPQDAAAELPSDGPAATGNPLDVLAEQALAQGAGGGAAEAGPAAGGAGAEGLDALAEAALAGGAVPVEP